MKISQLIIKLTLALAVATSLSPVSALAYPALKLAPEEYTAELKLGAPQIGALDISNPTGTSVTVTLEVEAFRQADNTGSLEYYPDERVAAGIIPAQTSFSLGPREAIRTKFTIDPNKLGPGGTYGVIFAETQPDTLGASQLNTSTRVGTVLILHVDGQGTSSGKISNTHISLNAKTLTLSLSYTNTGSGKNALAFTPHLAIAIGSARPQPILGPFVFPGRTRASNYALAIGSHLGPTKVVITDTTGGASSVSVYLWLITGYWLWLAPVILLIIIIGIGLWYFRRHFVGWLKRSVIKISVLKNRQAPAAQSTMAQLPEIAPEQKALPIKPKRKTVVKAIAVGDKIKPKAKQKRKAPTTKKPPQKPPLL